MRELTDGKRKPKVIVVTGASAGIGRAIVREFAKNEQAHIGLIARGRDGLEAAKREVDEAGGRGLVLPADVADAEQVFRAAERVEGELGPIDIWINDAMVAVFAPVKKISPADFRRVTEVTYLGFVHGTMAALKYMLPRDRGLIIQIGSALAFRSIPLQSAYCGAKHGMHGFTESLRCELIHDRSNVLVTMVNMPAVNTPQHSWAKNLMPRRPQPVPPIYQPEVAARAVYYASHHYRREWNVGLPTDVAINGNKVAPGLGDYYLGKTGYESQMTSEPTEPNAPNNLYEPLPGDWGAHGRFDGRATERCEQWWFTKNRDWLAAAGLGLVGLALLAHSRSERM